MKHLLNPSQKKASTSINGKVLVLAGAGSGKTSVLIERIVVLIEDHNVDPSTILGLTFTNKAAGEMRERIAARIGKSTAQKIPLLTFHSFCLDLLKKEIHNLGYSNNFSLYTEKDTDRIEKEVLEQLSSQEDMKITDALFRKELTNTLKSYNAVDFDGLLELTLKLLKEHRHIREKYQKFFKYIMIDEYQDTNAIQYELITYLSENNNNLFVVGDDDQSIYGFRGAKVDHIISFPHQTLIKLEENYRSTQPILSIANSIISKNAHRHKKTLFTKKTNDNRPRLFHAPSDAEEAESIIHRILYLKNEKNLKWSDIAILYRSNNLTKPFEVALMQASWKDNEKFTRGIPYHVVQGTSFYDRAEVKDIFSYLRILHNPKDNNALLRIINYPKRGVSSRTIEALSKESNRLGFSLYEALEFYDHLDISPQGKIGISILISILEKAKLQNSIVDTMMFLIKELDIKEEIKKEVKSDKARMFRLDNLNTCLEMAESADSNQVPLGDFINGSMIDNHKQSKKKDTDQVNLLTFHSAKGLEFKACFVVCLEDGILPHSKSLEDGSLEEERRLFYVAITRAKEYLFLSMARTRAFRGKQQKTNASRFIFDIPKTLLEFESFNNLMPFK